MAVSNQAQPRILLCSGMGATKDYRGALRLFARSRVLEHAQLRVVGFGHDAELARRAVAQLPETVGERIRVLSRLSLDELVDEYRGADVVWVHSRQEGFGRCVVEGRLAGRTVVATNIPAFRRHSELGIFLYDDDAFDTVAGRALAEPLRRAADPATFHKRLESALREALSGSSRNALSVGQGSARDGQP